MITIKMKITGMDCASCVNDIEKVFNKKTGIKVAVSYITQSALFNYDENV
jgi:copper chaperone CopZ